MRLIFSKKAKFTDPTLSDSELFGKLFSFTLDKGDLEKEYGFNPQVTNVDADSISFKIQNMKKAFKGTEVLQVNIAKNLENPDD